MFWSIYLHLAVCGFSWTMRNYFSLVVFQVTTVQVATGELRIKYYNKKLSEIFESFK